MSETNPPPVPPALPPTPAPLPQRSGCATAFMALFGALLLLPGLCAILFGVAILADQRPDPTIIFLVLLGLLAGFAGALLIYAAIKGR
jgi:hypothetical protein